MSGDKIMEALFGHLPPAGSEWSIGSQARWLRCAAHAIVLLYPSSHDGDQLLIRAVEGSSLRVTKTTPVGRASFLYGSETVRAVIVLDQCGDLSAYVAQGLERDLAAQGSCPGEAMRRLRALAVADIAVSQELGAEVPVAPPHVFGWYELAKDEP